MEHIDYLLLKAAVLVVLAFAWGIYCGATGRELNGKPTAGPPERPEE